MARFVRFVQFGGPEVLEVTEVDPPQAGEGQVRVRVKAAGLNPVDYKIFTGGPAGERYGVSLPSGNGSDFSGVVDEVGEGVAGLSLGDEVFGGLRFSAQADFVVVPQDMVVPKPEPLTFAEAGALDIAGRTAWASVRSLGLGKGDTVLVSAAAGGVGVLACQLALRHGATVVGTASEGNHEFLRSLGVVPVSYGEGLADRVRDAAPQGITAVLDNHGPETIDAGLELGVPGHRINTVAARGHASEHGIAGVGGQAADLRDLAELAELVAAKEVVLPIDSIYPLERVVQAYEHLMAGHARGKVVLATE